MKESLSYVLVTPYTIAKSRTGGVIARLLSRSDLELVGAQIITPNEDFVGEYAAVVRKQNLSGAEGLLANYIEQHLGPSGGRKHRSLFLIFKGTDACRKLSETCGPISPESRSFETLTGETIRDTYADLIYDGQDNTKPIYFEPAVLTPHTQDYANEVMALFVKYFKESENIVHNMVYPEGQKIEQTLVIIKPDNWSNASGRPGTIIDMFSRTGLRIVGTKVFSISLAQALDFYGPVEGALIKRLGPIFGDRALEVLEKEFSLPLDEKTRACLSSCFGEAYARDQFYQIVEFMSGRRPDSCPPEEAALPGTVKCMVLIYEGEKAVEKIRDVLGPTDPLKAPGGTVRREFGRDVMVNTAHASDSVESCEREKGIIKIDENPLSSIIEEYLS
ncbi:MAG: nucleoside-diphosphate kinase [Treponema sp.]|nr:nucleoside-diphosphate kinase [Treponema sp.]